MNAHRDIREEIDSIDRLAELDAAKLVIHRDERFDGDGFGSELARLADADVERVRTLYETVKDIYELRLYMRDEPNHEVLQSQIVKRFATDDFLADVHELGKATEAEKPVDDHLRRVFHDVRSGALTALTGYASLLTITEDPEEAVPLVDGALLLARDHAKLMRNALVDLDPLIRSADEGFRIHGIDDFVDKWRRARLTLAGRTVNVSVDCGFAGDITNRCLETSAIDRILYNLINNAARFAADDRVRLTIGEVPGGLVRWVVTNEIRPDQRDWLDERLGDDLSALFRGGLTRGGHGVGLSSCTQFVAASFGVDPDRALGDGYLGAVLDGRTYRAWFHWPSYVADAGEARCGCDVRRAP